MIERLARLGYASIGIVYALVGILAIANARGERSSPGGQGAAAEFLLHQPFGRLMLTVIALGLAGYAFWRVASALNDREAEGDGTKGIASRLFSAFRGLLYASLAVEIARIALRGSNASGGGDVQTHHWSARAMEHPGGRVALALAGLGAVGYGAWQLYAAWSSKLSKHLRLGSLDASMRRRIVAVSRFGIAARGVVLFIIGGSFVIAAVHHDASEARGTAEALAVLSPSMLAVIGVGFIAYGVYALVNARYRVV
jgi:hypothetical protein